MSEDSQVNSAEVEQLKPQNYESQAPKLKLLGEQGSQLHEELRDSPVKLVDDSAWHWNENTKGIGNKPEWFNEKTFKNIEEQAKSQIELRKKLGDFKGAPDEGYKFELEPILKDKGYPEVNMEDPLTKDFVQLAKASNMSNKLANALMNFYHLNIDTKQQEVKRNDQLVIKEELKKLGPNPQEITNNVTQWLQNNLDPELSKSVMENINETLNVDLIKAFDHLRKLNNYSQPSSSYKSGNQTIKHSDLKNMLKDPKYMRDRNFTSEVNNLYKQAFPGMRE